MCSVSLLGDSVVRAESRVVTGHYKKWPVHVTAALWALSVAQLAQVHGCPSLVVIITNDRQRVQMVLAYVLVWALAMDGRSNWAIAVGLHTAAASVIGAALLHSQFMQVSARLLRFG